MTVTGTDEVAAWCKRQQADLRQQVEMLRTGRMRVWQQRGAEPGMVDTTADVLARVGNSLADLDALVRRHWE